MEPVEIAAGRFQLRPWNEHDVDVIAGALADELIVHRPPVPEDEDPHAWLAAREQRWASGEGPSFAVMDAVSGEVHGHVALWKVSPQWRTAEVGYWTLKSSRGRGVARHGVGALTRWAFGALELHRLELRHAVANSASCAVANASGYALEGVLRGCLTGFGEEFTDVHLHARLATDT
ncbi:GNAT family N-acetyltransferase [Embleya sp. NPDC020630]|uniref:GNAT family N-acetyltransferase n=1 Tax=Embleya sp. NPDC020630 TaxID=3363979 RepID=UPI0037B0D91A